MAVCNPSKSIYITPGFGIPSLSFFLVQTFMAIAHTSASETTTTTQVVNAPEPYVYLATGAYIYQNPPSGSSGL